MIKKHHISAFIIFIGVIILFLVFTSPKQVIAPAKDEDSGLKPLTSIQMVLESLAFPPETALPPKFTCDAENISPPLEWKNVPDGTKTFALIMSDPDAPSGDWVHWIIWNIPGTTRLIQEKYAPEGAMVGNNDFGTPSWSGPCPPSGTHRYVFALYALDVELNLPENTKKDDLLKAMNGHVLAQAELMAPYKRLNQPTTEQN